MNFCMYYASRGLSPAWALLKMSNTSRARAEPKILSITNNLEELISINTLTSNISLSKRLQYNNIKPHVQGAFENSYLGNWYYIVMSKKWTNIFTQPWVHAIFHNWMYICNRWMLRCRASIMVAILLWENKFFMHIEILDLASCF